MFDDLEYRESFKRTVERELAQVKRVLDDLRNVARPMPLERFPLDVNKALAELVESMQPTRRERRPRRSKPSSCSARSTSKATCSR